MLMLLVFFISGTAALDPGDGDGDGRGYEVVPAEYLAPGQLAVLGESKPPVQLPTWLPDWTREVRPVAFLEPDGGYMVVWTIPYEGSSGSGLTQVAGTVQLSISGHRLRPSDELPVTWPQEEGPDGRRLWVSPQVRDCERPADEEELETTGRVLWADGDAFYLVTLDPAPACSAGNFVAADLIRTVESSVVLDLPG